MTLREIMTDQVIRIRPEESAAVAARTLAHYNIGVLPVCDGAGRICGLVTDRDLVTRCMAGQRPPEKTSVRQVMTAQVVSGTPDMQAEEAAQLMGSRQIRRLPVVENGRLCGMVSLGDLARYGSCAQEALSEICSNVSDRL